MLAVHNKIQWRRVDGRGRGKVSKCLKEMSDMSQIFADQSSLIRVSDKPLSPFKHGFRSERDPCSLSCGPLSTLRALPLHGIEVLALTKVLPKNPEITDFQEVSKATSFRVQLG